MRGQFLLLAGAATFAAANPVVEIFEKRNTADCQAAYTKYAPQITGDIPTAGDKLSSFIAHQTQIGTASITDPCMVPAVTGSMADEYTSYVKKLESWYKDEADALSSLIDACSDVPEVSAQLAEVTLTACSEFTWQSATGSPSKDDDDSGANSAPLRTGTAVAIAVVAGFFVAGFQALDVFGPLDVLNVLSKTTSLELSIIASTLDPVSTQISGPNGASVGQSVVPTHTFHSPPNDLEVLLVPGGMGTRDIESTQPVVDYVHDAFPNLRYLLTVCTGSALAARAGVLDGHEATSNKRSFSWVKTQGPKVRWVLEARWVTCDNIWTSSGISAGLDMMYAFVESQYGEEVAEDIAIASEYSRSKDPKVDPFAKHAR
ncbi:hypothetical protein G7046_g3109 [Stylonectria norvegica]|nr:hypothetical protein G7046_g3109 [Stylonectria norvegica]